MAEALGSSTLWAMEAGALTDLTERTALAAILPPALAKMAGMGAGRGAPLIGLQRAGGAAIIPLSGPLSPKGSYGGTSTERFADLILDAGNDPTIRVIVVPVASEGGMVIGTAEAADAVFVARRAKPILAVASPTSFSAAHWIASQASAYYASTSAQVGCMGVRAAHVDVSGFEAKIGMRTTLVASDREKIAGSPYAPLSDIDWADMKDEVDQMNRAFAHAVARGRGASLTTVGKVHGTGQRYSAQRAAARGMIDGVKTLRDVIALAINDDAALSLIHRRAGLRRSAVGIEA